jgi:uncharacterized protein HemX
MSSRRIGLDRYETIIALLACAVIGLAIIFSFMTYNFIQVKNQILDNENLIKRTALVNLDNTVKNRDNIANMLKNLTSGDNKLDKLLNQTSSSK